MTDETTFEQALNNLETAVNRLEEGQLSLDEALDCFEAGVQSATLCRNKLQVVEARIETLMKDSRGVMTREAFAVSGDRDDA